MFARGTLALIDDMAATLANLRNGTFPGLLSQ
jgi:hypothetical protein